MAPVPPITFPRHHQDLCSQAHIIYFMYIPVIYAVTKQNARKKQIPLGYFKAFSKAFYWLAPLGVQKQYKGRMRDPYLLNLPPLFSVF